MSERPVKVLFLMIDMAMGGSERLVLNLATHVNRARFEPAVAWLSSRPALPEFTSLGIPLFSIPKVKRADWSAVRTLARVIREHSIDVVNAHHFMPFVQGWSATRISRAGLVYTEHSEADVMSASGKWRTIGRHLLRSSDAVGISTDVSARLVSHFHVDPSRVHTIENGIDLRLFDGRADRRAEIRRRLGFSPDDFLVGHVANFRHNKNHLFLIKAYETIAATHPSAHLVLVGQGFAGDPENSEPAVREFVQARGLSGRVHLLGYRPDVHDVLRTLDVFCLTSYKEGLPLSVIEAMASGLPIVATDIPALRPLVEPGVNGWLVAPDDVPNLGHALGRLAADTVARERMGAASRARATDSYSLQRCVLETERLFHSVVARGRNRRRVAAAAGAATTSRP